MLHDGDNNNSWNILYMCLQLLVTFHFMVAYLGHDKNEFRQSTRADSAFRPDDSFFRSGGLSFCQGELLIRPDGFVIRPGWITNMSGRNMF